MWKTIKIGEAVEFGDHKPLILVAGPCVIESKQLVLDAAAKIKDLTAKYNVPFIFKSSFDKANRTSISSFRGPGLEAGLTILAEVKQRLQIPILTDIHSAEQAAIAANVVDVLQIPAFLCRQTDLLIAAGETGKVVNIKKGQFMDAESMIYAAKKVFSTGNEKVVITERGNSFGYSNLIVDMRNLPRLHDLGLPVIFDGTHSVQEQKEGGVTLGNRRFVESLSRAAIAVGVDGLFLEVHPNPDAGLSDATNMISYDALENILNFISRFEKNFANNSF
jgi:2-dehydro-3-deoxyphosphooctonate aldolase (KDO 8-P synthase)